MKWNKGEKLLELNFLVIDIRRYVWIEEIRKVYR